MTMKQTLRGLIGGAIALALASPVLTASQLKETPPDELRFQVFFAQSTTAFQGAEATLLKAKRLNQTTCPGITDDGWSVGRRGRSGAHGLVSFAKLSSGCYAVHFRIGPEAADALLGPFAIEPENSGERHVLGQVILSPRI